MRQPPSVSREAGFSVIEAMIAVTVLGIVLLSLGPLSIRAARSAVEANAATHQTAIITSEIGRLDAVAFDSLPSAGTTCTTVSTPPFPHTRCTTVINVSSQKKQLIVVVTPSGNALLRPDTTVVERTKEKSNPLNKQ